MTDAELDRLAELVAGALLRSGATGPARTEAWLPIPVRPAPSRRGTEPPVWSGAGQSLESSDARAGTSRGHRASTAELANATRAAAAGRGAPPAVAPRGRMRIEPSGRARGGLAIEVPIGVSARHIHLSPAHARILLGRDDATSARAISQPGQFAAVESLAVVGPRGRFDAVRIVGPARGETQVELSRADARAIGVDAPLSASGSLATSTGGITLAGPVGSVQLDRGVIIAARHLHLSPADAARWGLRDGDRLDVRCGSGARAVTFHDVLVRSGPTHVTEMHLDVDEANAAALRTGDRGTILVARAGMEMRKRLVTESDVQALARSGGALPAGALLTPSARDRARALGLLTER